MRPVPTHLRPILVELQWLPYRPGIQVGVLGHLKCQCGSQTFTVSYAADLIEERGKHFLRVTEHEGRFFLVIKAGCRECAKVHLLLDMHVHGWNGMLCSNPEERDAVPPPFAQWHCPACAGDSMAVTIGIDGDDRALALEEGEGHLDDSNWFDAFGDIRIDVKCSGECPPMTIVWYETQ
jgi:hypothetical protein